MMIFQSHKIFPRSDINFCALFWRLVSPQTHISFTQTSLPSSYFIILQLTCSNMMFSV